MATEIDSFQSYLAAWREILDKRTKAAIATISAIPGVIGIILGGSIGRGAPWPLSDIDLIYVAADRHDRVLPQRVDKIGLKLSDQFPSEGWATSVDVGKLYLTTEEAHDLVTGRRSVEELMVFERIFHGLDKCYRGRPVYTSNDCDVEGLAELLTAKRFTEPIMLARQRVRLRQASEVAKEARRYIKENNLVKAAVSVELLARPLVPFLLESWHKSDNSFARLFTRCLREASRRGEDDVASQILDLFRLNDDEVEYRFEAAPPHVVARHNQSHAARRCIGEAVHEIDDQRDVLYAFSWYAIRSGELEDRWVGLVIDVSAVSFRLEAAISTWNGTLARMNPVLLEEASFV